MAETQIPIKMIKDKGNSFYPATVIDAIKDGKPTIKDAQGQEIANPDCGKSLRELLKESETPTMDEGYVSDVIVGGLNKNTNVGGMTAVEVLDLILKPEYAPVYTAATASIACEGHTADEVVEVGTATPAESLYTSSGNKAKTAAGSASSHVVYGGEATESFSITTKTAGTNLTYESITTKPGKFTVKATRAYAAGTDEVETNKGNATNKAASNYTTLLANASASSYIDSSNHIKATTKEASFTINYAYKVYASTVAAGTLTSLGLKTSVSNLEATLKAGAAGLKFAVPATYTGVKIEEYNDTLKSWTDTTDGWNVTTTTYKVADGSDVTYNVYSRANVTGGDLVARISATVA